MKQLILFLFTLLFCYTHLTAKQSPTEITYSVMDLHALRYYPFTQIADSLVLEIINNHSDTLACYQKKKTTLDFIGNREFIEGQINYSIQANDLLYKYFLKSYLPWLKHATSLKEDNKEIVLTLGLHQESRDENLEISLYDEGIYGFLGKRNIGNLMDDLFGDIDLFKKDNEILFLSVKSPLSKDRMHLYYYFLASEKTEEGEEIQEIVFFPKNIHTEAFTGYLHITKNLPHQLKKAVFTINNSYDRRFINDVLFSQEFQNNNKNLPTKKEYTFSIGEEIKGSFVVNRVVDYADKTEPITASEAQIEELIQTTNQTRAFNNVKMITRFALTDYLSLQGEKGVVEIGPVSRMLSYNDIEGMRLRLGGNTTLNLHKHWLVGGYAAYGVKDKEWKYRGDIKYSFQPKDRDIWEFPKRLISFTYINDLNIPGEDLLITNRDNIFYSFSQIATRKMTKQKLSALSYEHETQKDLFFMVGAKFLKDIPMSGYEYYTHENNSITKIEKLISSEVNFSLRFAPKEVFFQTRDKRRSLKSGRIVLDLKYRVGLKNIFNSDYSYHITEAEIYKEFKLPSNIGRLNMEIAARKVWNRLPFPYLFVAGGNQSYIFKESNYNLMNYSEFVTDRFIAGNLNVQFNWSPFQLFFKNNIKTNLGTKTLYGPMSDNNNPDFHPELFVLNEGVSPLKNTPYMEVNFGFSNILKFIRVEWIQRLTYLNRDTDGNKKNRGSLFVNASFSF